MSLLAASDPSDGAFLVVPKPVLMPSGPLCLGTTSRGDQAHKTSDCLKALLKIHWHAFIWSCLFHCAYYFLSASASPYVTLPVLIALIIFYLHFIKLIFGVCAFSCLCLLVLCFSLSGLYTVCSVIAVLLTFLLLLYLVKAFCKLFF